MRKQITKHFYIISALLIIYLCNLTPNYAQENTLTLGVYEDTYAEEGFPDILTWNQRNFFIGYDSSAGKLRTRAFLKYDLELLSTYDIRNADIVGAELKLWQYYSSGYGRIVSIYEPTQYWSQYYLTWNNQPAVSFHKEVNFTGENGWQNADITDLIKKQILYGNNGISLRNKNETSRAGIFWSNACMVAPTPPICESYQTPRVELIYKVNEAPSKPELLTPNDNFATTSKEVMFEWATSTDPTSDTITYKLEISGDIEFNDLIFAGDWQTNDNHMYMFEGDGLYYWRITAKDDRTFNTGYSFSNIRNIEIDTTAPNIPVIEPEPPYTFGQTNSIFWQFDGSTEQHQVTFSIEVSEFSNFSIIADSVSTTTLGYSFSNLEEKQYFYRVKAIDFLGNTSDWSQTTDSFQDYSSPLISDISLSEKYISPLSSPNVQDYSSFSVNISDSTLKTWNFIIENALREIVYSATGSTSTISTDWGVGTTTVATTTDSFQDGYYFVYITAEDNVGLFSKSEIETFVVDNLIPPSPIITSPASNSLTNNKSIRISTYFEPFIHNEISLNSYSLLNATSSSFSQDTLLTKEGTNIIFAKSTDFAGNTSSSELTFTTDWTAPLPPSVELIPNSDEKKIDLLFYSADYQTAYIYNLAGLHTILTYPSNSVTVVPSWSSDSKYSFYVVLKDLAGNIGSASEIVSFTTPKASVLGIGDFNENNYASPSVPTRSLCKYKLNGDTFVLTKLSCDFPGPFIDQLFHKTQDKQNFSVESWGGYDTRIDFAIALVRCKKKNILNPLTWYSCQEVPIKQSMITINNGGDMIGYVGNSTIYSASRVTINDTSFGTKFFTKQDYSNNNLTLASKVVISKKITPSNWIDIYELSSQSNAKLIPSYTYTPTGNGKYFRFPFNRIVPVTQWHGYTAYDSPHTGIDFGVYREPIYAMADGYVSAVGWDNYYGDCFSGGNYIKIAHDNGMSSFFAHLENYNRADGRAWTVGERVGKGDLIGLTGNSGSSNCQALGYHLHFELRQDLWQASHVNPVGYIDTDWSQVVTMDSNVYPGRLSGDNPHPSY